jgi:hypothetical protein
MDIELNLQHPDEMEAFAAFLTATAQSRRKRPHDPIGLFGLSGGIDRSNHALWQSATRQAEDAIPEETDEPELPAGAVTTEAPKRTRRTKAEIAADAAKAAETVANLDPAVVAEAAAAGVHVQAETADQVENNDAAVDEPEADDKQVEEQPALTENDVRNSIIDLLNEAQAKFPADADVRTKTLAPILAALGAQKISLIPATEYHRVAGILAKARTDMDQALAEAA